MSDVDGTDPTTVRRWRRVGIALAIAIVAACIVIAATVVDSGNDAERQREVLALLSSEEGISLTGAGDVIARVVPSAGGSRFAIAGVEAAPEGRTYQLWLMRGEGCPSREPAECEVVSAGTFDTEDGAALLELDHDVTEWENAEVTIEPAAGSEFPTRPPIADSS